MSVDYSTISLHLVSALGAGAVIGLERTIHGHPAGFRTHVLVCLACSLLMLMTLYQSSWLSGGSIGSIGADTSRMAQGIMTGIGFLGAGVIFKEGISIRGLTTAASIWVTAAIGILLGLGFYFPAVLGTALTLGVLTLFNSIEKRLPRESYAQYHVSFDRNNVLPESEIRKLVTDHGFSIANMSYRITQAGLFEYRMDIRTTRDPDRTANLAETLRTSEMVREFRISTTGN
jgi:putative Mg2+ transporter-C (MgtC) family protein